MCQRCEAVRSAVYEAAKAGSLGGAANLIARIAVDAVVALEVNVRQVLPEVMTDPLPPYGAVKALLDAMQVMVEFETDPANGHLEHEGTTPGDVVDAEYTEYQPPAPFSDVPVKQIEDADLKLGDEILRDMLGEEPKGA